MTVSKSHTYFAYKNGFLYLIINFFQKKQKNVLEIVSLQPNTRDYLLFLLLTIIETLPQEFSVIQVLSLLISFNQCLVFFEVGIKNDHQF